MTPGIDPVLLPVEEEEQLVRDATWRVAMKRKEDEDKRRREAFAKKRREEFAAKRRRELLAEYWRNGSALVAAGLGVLALLTLSKDLALFALLPTGYAAWGWWKSR